MHFRELSRVGIKSTLSPGLCQPWFVTHPAPSRLNGVLILMLLLLKKDVLRVLSKLAMLSFEVEVKKEN